ncbi:hypothetical protein [Acinetobacter sp. WCHAc010052]|uniref:hypothetical protein n=1 Tax=Acinetobacter sp. WCHAc010052 TaxID=2004647 RepID=UPI0011C43A5E|nr:hypothetical protein [Acinetobacter sp. WCHAc010052]
MQTSVLLMGIFTLLVFGASYYFVLSDSTPTEQPLKDTLSITASFFGGFTTLTAAYIASRLFNDWKDQQRHQNSLEFAKIVLDSYKVFDRSYDDLIDILLCKLEFLKEEIEIDSSEFDELLDKGYKVVNLFYYFHDDLLNFYYVSNSKYQISQMLSEWEDNIHLFFETLNNLSDTETGNQEKLIITEELTSEPFTTLSADFNEKLVNIVLKPLRLEN